MLSLLHECKQPGYPSEYLVSRIHGRIQTHASPATEKSMEADAFFSDDKSIWEEASEERRWLYTQMNITLRGILAPVFVFYELDALIVSLRNLESVRTQSGREGVEQSLLAEKVKKNIKSVATSAEVIKKMEKIVAGSSVDLSGMSEAYEKGEVQRCEELIRKKFFQQIASISSRSPEVLCFFRLIIDLKNTMAIAKYIRWKKMKSPGLINGGFIRLQKSEQVLSEEYLRGVARHFTGGQSLTAAELHPVVLEPLLYAWMTKKMMRQMRGFCPVECCIGYLWHSFIRTKKRSQAFHGNRFVENFTDSGERL